MNPRSWSLGAAALALAMAVPWGLLRPAPSSDFGRLPVLHEGRVKPLESVARGTLLLLRGKQTMRRDGKTVAAIDWLLDAASRPGLTDRDPAFRIDDPDVLSLLGKGESSRKHFSFGDLAPSLAEIDRQASRAAELEPGERSRFQGALLQLHAQLVTYQRLKATLRPPDSADFPAEIEAFLASIGPGLKALHGHQASKGYDQEALTALNSRFQRLRSMSEAALFRPLPPAAEGGEWKDLGEGLLTAMKDGNPHPSALPLARALAAREAGNEAGARVALATLRTASDQRQRDAARSAASEWAFHQSQPFVRGMALYLAAFLLGLAVWLRPGEGQRSAARIFMLAALGLHTVGLVWRMLIEARPPVTNLYSSAVFVGWTAALLGAVLERSSRRGFGTAMGSAVGFATLIIAHHLAVQGDTMEVMRAVLDSNFWLATHVVTITIGYGCAFLAGGLAHLWIFRRLAAATVDPQADADLYRAVYGAVALSLFFSFIGTVLGGIWADQSWGRFWGWDPKENGALLIVAWMAVILHSRWGGLARERGVMAMAVFGGVVTAFSWFGVNMLGIGLHSYGFMDKAFVWLAAYTAFELAVIGLAYLPPLRHVPITPGARAV